MSAYPTLLPLGDRDEKVHRFSGFREPLRSLASRGGALFLMGRPVSGHDTGHERVRVWPKRTLLHCPTPRAGRQRPGSRHTPAESS